MRSNHSLCLWALLALSAIATANAATTYYVAAGGDDSNDGLAEASAKATIAAAMACLSEPYDQVMVCDGVFENSTPYVLSNGWNVVSKNGSAHTKILVTAPHTMFTWRTKPGSGPSSTVQGFTVEPKDGARFKFCFANLVYDQGASLSNADRYSKGYGYLRDCVFRNLGTMLNDTSLVVTNALYPIKTMTNPPIVYDALPNSTIANCVFEGCQGYGDKGAALYINGNAAIVLTDSKFIACSGHASSATYSGTICMPTQGGKIRNCLIAYCTNTIGTAGISIYNMGNNDNLFIESSTIAYCMTTNSTTVPGGLYDNLGSGTSPRLNLRNCLIYGCENNKGPANFTTPRAAYNCASSTEITPYVKGGDNLTLTASPFKDEAQGDFTLKNGPCVDAGLNQSWMNNVTDLAGNPRKYNDTVDIGCYEYVPGALNAEITATPNTVLGANAAVTLEALADGEYTGALTYSWTVADHASGTTVATASGTDRATLTLHLPLGEYDVSLTVEDEASKSVSKTETRLFKVVPAAVYIAHGSTPAFPYDTKATAFRRLEDALDFAVDGMQIVFAEGVHTNTAQIDVVKNVTIRGENGADGTTLASTNFVKGAYMLRLYSAGAIVRDLTLRGPGLITSLNGKKVTSADNQWRAINIVTGGAVSDCVFTNFAGSYIVYNGSASSAVGNCLFHGNVETGNDGLIGGVQGALFTHCRFLRNTLLGCPGIAAGFVSTLRNCLIAENASEYSSGSAFLIDMYYGNGMDLAIVESCTIVSNKMKVAASNLPAVRNYCGFARNNIVAFNTLANGTCKDFALGTLSGKQNNATYNVTTTPGTVENCIGSAVGDPRLKNPAKGDYRLKASSPLCSKMGLVQDWMSDACDLDGNPRLIKGAVDIGCYQGDPRRASFIFLQ